MTAWQCALTLDHRLKKDWRLLYSRPLSSVVVVVLLIAALAGIDAAVPFPAAAADGPTVTRLDPSEGPVKGGTYVEVTGTGLGEVTQVKFGGSNATILRVRDNEHVIVLSPAHAPGAVDVTVVTPVGTSALSVGSRFTYLDPSSGAWRSTTAPTVARSGHTATLLSNGKVLVIGGCCTTDGENALASAEIYDPASESWTLTGSLAEGRFNHSATLLTGPGCGAHCGKVLVAGGDSMVATSDLLLGTFRTQIASVELFDPAANSGTGAWSSAPPLHHPRAGHTASLLRNGRVLATGGSAGFGERLASSEIYDPSLGLQGAWQATGPLQDPRDSHTATLLSTGEVLVAGGLGYRDLADPDADGTIAILDSAEVYQPTTGLWRQVGPLATARLQHSATLLGGGACSRTPSPTYCNKVLVAGGNNNAPGDPALNSSELYGGAEWAGPGLLKAASMGHVAALLPNGKVLLAGGGGSRVRRNTSQLYDPATNSWSWTASSIKGSDSVRAVVLPSGPRAACGANCGRVLLVGTGLNSGTLNCCTQMAELFNAAPEVTSVTPQKGPVEGGASVEIAGFGLSSTTQVSFGGAHAEFVLDPDTPDSKITVVAPSHVSGRVPITISTEAEPGLKLQSVATDIAQFTYLGAPAQVTDLSADAASATSVKLSFTAPDDGTGAPASNYVVKQSIAPISAQNFDDATSLCSGVCSFDGLKALGDPVTLTVTSLKPETTYYFALKAQGEIALGPMSNVASVVTPPAAVGEVVDLEARPLSARSVELTFSAPDDGSGSPAARYVVKQSVTPIDADNFDDAMSLCDGTCNVSGLKGPGDPVTLTVTDLKPKTTYYFALKPTRDGAAGPMSNLASATTLSAAVGEVVDLEARAISPDALKLRFSAPDDGSGEPADSYIVKQSTTPISEQNFKDAKSLCGGECSFTGLKAPADPVTLTVTELTPKTTYYFALKAIGDGGPGAISNLASERLPRDRVRPGRVSDLRARVMSRTKIRLLFSAVGSDRAGPPPVTKYVIKQARKPIRTGKRFRRARSLCSRKCRFAPEQVGDRLVLTVTDLRPRRTYYYAVQAVDASGNRSRRSRAVRAVTRRVRR